MELPIYQVDAFTHQVFNGNPACVVPLQQWLDDELLLKIAQENAVAETAFFVQKEAQFHIRWFTPEIEMDLCGHATLATAHVIQSELNHTIDIIQFQSASGLLEVVVHQDLYTLNFPSRPPKEAQLPDNIKESLSKQPLEVLKSRDYVLIYETEEEIKNLTIDRQQFDLLNLDPGGVIITAPGRQTDFVSRFFTPQASILEDPVTGSAHCSLIPFWAARLGKQELIADQVSARGGRLYCENRNERVLISGKAITYLSGVITI